MKPPVALSKAKGLHFKAQTASAGSSLRSERRGIALFVVLGMLMARSVSAQMLDLTLRDLSSRAPVVGAIVTLLRDTTLVVRGLTNASGRVLLRAPAGGAFRVKVMRIGFRASIADDVQLESGRTVRRTISPPSVRVELAALAVKGESRCEVRAEEGQLAATLWEDIRNALTANVMVR